METFRGKGYVITYGMKNMKKTRMSSKDDGKRRVLALLHKKGYMDGQSIAKELKMPVNSTYRILNDNILILDPKELVSSDKSMKIYKIKEPYKKAREYCMKKFGIDILDYSYAKTNKGSSVRISPK